jgi:hypothetical protein
MSCCSVRCYSMCCYSMCCHTMCWHSTLCYSIWRKSIESETEGLNILVESLGSGSLNVS